MKKYIIPVAAFIAGMAIVPSVFAADNGNDTSIKSLGDLDKCVESGEYDTCTYAGNAKDLAFNSDGTIEVKKDITINLGGQKMDITKSNSNGAFQIADGATLTITNGSIEGLSSYENAVFSVAGSLVLDTDVKAVKPFDTTSPEKIVINSNVYGLGTGVLLSVDGPASFFNTTPATVEINGLLSSNGATAYAYKQGGNVNATIRGSVSQEGGDAVVINAGTVALEGATLNAKASALFLSGESKATIKCSTITSKDGAALYINGGAKIESLIIKSSALTSTNASTINGGNASEVKTVTIDGSRFVAKKDAMVKVGGTNFVKATYDGRELAEDENVLTTAKGSYGTLAACDATADEDEGEDKGEEAENPNTADTIATYMTIAAVALLGLGATAFVAKKSNR